MKFLMILLLTFLICTNTYGQQYYKMSCDVTIKEKMGENSFSIIKGKAEYDKYSKKTIYNITFPENEQWILSTDSLIKIANNQIVFKQQAGLIDYSIFKIFLEGNLKNFGLKNSVFKITDVSEQKGKIQTTWEVPETSKHKFGKIITSQNDNKLEGVAIFDTENVLVSRIVFADYMSIKGLLFPSKIIQEYYTTMGKQIRMTTFQNIVIQ